ncbi:MAG: peptide-methionine (S)-S-oxide reductase MsrA [Clostridia bacterium]
MMRKLLGICLLVTMLGTLLAGAAIAQENAGKAEESGEAKVNEQTIYLAGGCFWGMEKLMQGLNGVMDVVSGYANGHTPNPTYEAVCGGDTGYRETVKVQYDANQISLDAILFAYFAVIDPTVQNRQGNDSGEQYQTGIYYADEESRLNVERVAEIEKGRSKAFYVEIAPLQRFYDAEEYHQNYLDKNPGGYCHISPKEISALSGSLIDPGDYQRPAKELLKERLSKEQYAVTQEADTERPFQNAFWNNHERGIYVDVATGEPLFRSSDQFESACGWPAFSAPIDPNVVILEKDDSIGMERVEVRSRAGDSHLGHVFYGESEAPEGVRFCINSAALRFVPYEQMDAEGYGYLKAIVE